MEFSCASLPSIVRIFNSKQPFMPISSLKIAHLPCLKILWVDPISTSKLVHENFTTNFNEMHSKQPSIGLGS